MKKLLAILTMVLTFTVSANAMSYKQAREQALFLTDKMAYELNLNEEKYDAVYEINLDYLMGVNTYDDLYGPYWRYRNLDLSYVLFDWQYNAFCSDLLLSSAVFQQWLLALCHLHSLSTPRLFLLQSSYGLCELSWHPLLGTQPRTLLVQRAHLWLTQP